VICFISTPYLLKAIKAIKKSSPEDLLVAMGSTLILARITGMMLIISYLLAANPPLNLTNL
jgi:hypothetical protein